MNKLISIGNQYIKESDWKVIAALKFCLLSLGTMFGISLPKKSKKIVYLLCIPVFIITYIPLMMKLVDLVKKNK